MEDLIKKEMNEIEAEFEQLKKRREDALNVAQNAYQRLMELKGAHEKLNQLLQKMPKNEQPKPQNTIDVTPAQ